MNRPRLSTLRKMILPVAALLISSLACGVSVGSPPESTPDPALVVLAAPELADLEPLLPEIQSATGVVLRFEYSPTVSASGRLVKDPAGIDLAWLATSRYLMILQTEKSPALAQEQTMRSPVVVGVKLSKALALGWVDEKGQPKTIPWAEIARAAGAGEFRYAMADPNLSNAGFSGLASAATALSGSGGALQKVDLTPVDPRLNQFLMGQVESAPDAAALTELYLAKKPGLDGVVTYESELFAINARASGDDPLVAVTPAEGVISADYPLILVNPARSADYDRLRAYLRSNAFQALMARQTHRRPVTAQALMQVKLPARLSVEQPFPPTRTVITELLARYQEARNLPRPQAATPAPSPSPSPTPGGLVTGTPGPAATLAPVPPADQVIYLIDVSNTMGSGRLVEVKRAFGELLAAPPDPPRRWLVIAYNQGVAAQNDLVIDPANPDGIDEARGFFDSLEAKGGSAAYSALLKAYYAAEHNKAENPSARLRVVMIIDGPSTQGSRLKDFTLYFNKTAAVQDVPLYVIAVDEADRAEWSQVAEATGGALLDGDLRPLSEILRELQ